MSCRCTPKPLQERSGDRGPAASNPLESLQRCYLELERTAGTRVVADTGLTLRGRRFGTSRGPGTFRSPNLLERTAHATRRGPSPPEIDAQRNCRGHSSAVPRIHCALLGYARRPPTDAR
jgi:hypothetical protein